MSDLAQIVRVNAERINALHKRINETVPHRTHSPADREAWSEACKAFHHAYPDLIFPGGVKCWTSLLARDPAEMEAALAFLEVDPWFFRSGYLKQIIWSRLKKSLLTQQQEDRLEIIAVSYLRRPTYREFWHMARYVRVRGSSRFWAEISELAKQSDEEKCIKAGWLLLAKRNIPVKNWIGSEFLRASYEHGYVPDLSLKAQLSKLVEPETW